MAVGQSPPQELEVSPRSGLYLLVPSKEEWEAWMERMPDAIKKGVPTNPKHVRQEQVQLGREQKVLELEEQERRARGREQERQERIQQLRRVASALALTQAGLKEKGIGCLLHCSALTYANCV